MSRTFLVALAVSLVATPALAQSPQNEQERLALAVDRCMNDYAVRLADSGASDDDIYAQAQQGCAGLNDQLTASINARYPPALASEVLGSMNEEAENNFMQMLDHVRGDSGPGDAGQDDGGPGDAGQDDSGK